MSQIYRFEPRRQPEPPRPDWRQPRLSVGSSLAIVLFVGVLLWWAALSVLAALLP